MKKQQGFTLIELVVVIIILGILAVTAAPKFINLQDDAKASAIAGLGGAISGANSLVFSKAALTGQEQKATGFVDVLGNTDYGDDGVPGGTGGDADTNTADDVAIVYGYMAATEAALEDGLDVTIDASTVTNPTADWILTAGTGSLTLHQRGNDSSKLNTCSVLYTQATANAAATAVIRNDDC